MVDLHSHILPGLDDGPSTIHFSLAMAGAAADAGTQIVVATPHIRRDRRFALGEIALLVEELNSRLAASQVPLRILTGGEIHWAYVPELTDDELAQLRLGSSNYLLVETPLSRGPADIEAAIELVVARGYKALLAHPERSPVFQRDPDRLQALVERGALCSITAASMLGRFGKTARDFTLELFRRGLVHDVASDSHDHLNRPPGLIEAFDAFERPLPGIVKRRPWYTTTAPVAILSGRPLPPPPSAEPPAGRLRQLVGRLTQRSD